MRYLTTFVSAVKHLFQSWKKFHEMNRSPAHGTKNQRFPSCLHHKASGQVRVRIAGRDYYLGIYGSDESRIRYLELVSRLDGGIPIDPIADSTRGRVPRNESDDPGPSVAELCLTFLHHAETHFVKNGRQTSEFDILKAVLRPLNELYGMLPAKDFGSLALEAVRQKFVDAGWVRDTLNESVGRIRRESLALKLTFAED